MVYGVSVICNRIHVASIDVALLGIVLLTRVLYCYKVHGCVHDLRLSR